MLASHVAIIHSGGDSRRSPLHSVSGKAWSSLNCAHTPRSRRSFSTNETGGDRDEEGGYTVEKEEEEEEEEGGDSEMCLYASPLVLLLRELSDILRRLPPPVSPSPLLGALLVASSDVLVSLQLPQVSQGDVM